LSEISKGSESLGETCPKCKHPKLSHMRLPAVDEQRIKLSMKLGYSNCAECWKLDKECDYYLKKK
jgi:hypothetical protein